VRKACVAIGLTVFVLTGWATPVSRPDVSACGPFISFPVFTPAGAPAEQTYFAGDLGIIQPRYGRRYLLVAWRALENRPLSAAEQSVFTSVPAREQDAVDVWRRVRRATPVEWQDNVSSGGWISATYSYYVNCSDSAFLTAARMLEADRTASALSATELLEWVRAQDIVFSNCGRRFEDAAAVPAPLDAGASAAARADRAYQIASALFYGGRFDEAEAAFEAIAKDPGSRWRTWGRYLAARATIRKATLATEDAEKAQELMRRAEAILREVIDDRSLAERHQAASQLLDFVRARTKPTESLVDAAKALDTPGGAEAFRQHLGTYEYLLNRYNSDGPDRPNRVGDPRGASELLDWVLTFQSGGDEAVSHALDRWHATGSPAWLVAALTHAKPDARQREELLKAASAIASDSPAFASVAFHRARLLLVSGHASDARRVLSELQSAPHLPQSAANLVKAAQLATATTFDEYLDAAVRSQVETVNTENALGASTPAALDRDVIDAVNQRFPLAIMIRAARNARLPPEVRREIALAAFARAVLLDRPDGIRELLPVVSQAEPSLVQKLQLLRSAADDRALRNEGMLLLLALPGLRPFVTAGRSRDPGDFATIDNLRDNWWCAFSSEGVVPYETQYWRRGAQERLELPQQGLYADASTVPDPVFLTADDRRQAKVERQLLKRFDTAPNELGRRVLEWSRTYPKDPRVPEALHRVVRATRYGCTNDATGAVSRDAFRLLHARYPTSPWTAKTPLWFK